MTEKTKQRDDLKKAFVLQLSKNDRAYLLDKRGMPVRHWAKEPEARRVHESAISFGLYSAKTVPHDTLAALRNFIVRYPWLTYE